MLKIFLIVKDERVIWFEVRNIFFFILGDFFLWDKDCYEGEFCREGGK